MIFGGEPACRSKATDTKTRPRACPTQKDRARAPRQMLQRVNARDRQERLNLREEQGAGKNLPILRSSVDAWPTRPGPTTTVETLRRASLPGG
eukprot:9164457-Pyramimonas_sp.AAC.1